MTLPEVPLTASAERILSSCQLTGADVPLAELAGQVVFACLQEESLAGTRLRQAGIHSEMIQPYLTPAPGRDHTASSDSENSTSLTRVLEAARAIARCQPESDGVSSEHLLAATLQFDSPVGEFLLEHGFSDRSLAAPAEKSPAEGTPIPVSFSISDEPDTGSVATESVSDPDPDHRDSPLPAPELPFTGQLANTDRVLDACLNRAREGLRVLEDYTRFLLNHQPLVSELKALRHQLAAAEQRLTGGLNRTSRQNAALVSRNVAEDVGTRLTGAREQIRTSADDIVHANARRVQESLRSLEEFGKLLSGDFAEEMKQLRYRSYEVHQALLAAAVPSVGQLRRRRLQTSTVCVLITEQGCQLPWQDVVQACLDGGADVLQLREKHLDTSELIDRAGWLADRCRGAGALSVMNDRADLAVAAGTDGVHVGQDDLAVENVRGIVGADVLIGLSTHSINDFQAARGSSADYLGVGPVFPSSTKQFDEFVGVDLVRQAVQETLPWFAIGGINRDRCRQVAEAGGRRVAVSASVIATERPDRAVRELKLHLTSAGAALDS